MSKLLTLKDALLDELKDLYSAENQLLKALPKMEKKASNQRLKEAFHAHLLETERQVERLNEIASLLDEKLTGKTCKAMQGLIEEGKEVLEEKSENEALLDALLIGAAQRVEHYEIAGYGTARAMAEELEEEEVVRLLEETLEEEGDADKKLSAISEEEVLSQACSFGEDESAESEEKKSVSPKSRDQKKGSNAARLFGLLSFFLLTLHVGIVSADTTQNNMNTAGTVSRDKIGSQLSSDDNNITPGGNVAAKAKNDRQIVDNSGRTAMRDPNGTQLSPDDNDITPGGNVNAANRTTPPSAMKDESRTVGYKADNTGKNVRDRNDARVTADDQSLRGGNDLQVLAQIRREITANEDLSLKGHNVKIIVENGKVTLRGPVKSAQEKEWIAATSTRIASGYNVVNQLEVAPG